MTNFSFIIPHRRNENISQTVSAIKDLSKIFHFHYEILSISGNHPTVQRNRCIKQASYKILWFIDNDSKITASAIKNALKFSNQKFSDHSSKSQMFILGGPSVEPENAPFISKMINFVFSSDLAIGAFSARYFSKGTLRQTDDSELILCNLIISKDVFEVCGLLNEKLYPNEENEFIQRALTYNTEVWYHPDIYIHRNHRTSVKSFIRQIFTYGRGRGEQTRLNFRSFKLSLILPIGFTVYMILWFMLFPFYAFHVLKIDAPMTYLFYLPGFYILLTGLYFLKNFIKILSHYIVKKPFSLQKIFVKNLHNFFSIPFFFLCHFLYGLGFFKGLFSKKFQNFKKSEISEIKIYKS